MLKRRMWTRVALAALAGMMVGCGAGPVGVTAPAAGGPVWPDEAPGYQLQQLGWVEWAQMLNQPVFVQVRYIFREVNAMRAAAGIPALVLDANMTRAAARHSRDMAMNNYVAHKNQAGEEADARMRAAGVTFNFWAENISDQPPPDDTAAQRAMTFWRGSEGHRNNIVNKTFRRTGIFPYKRTSDGWWLYTQVFAD